MSRLEAWLDVMPGETRAIVAQGGRFERLLVHRDDDTAAHRLGARVVGRVSAVEPSLGGAFVDLGEAPLHAFLPLEQGRRIDEGARIEAIVIAEPRGGKGPVLRMTGPGAGEPRLLSAGPGPSEFLARHAPGVVPVQGVEAIQASWDAEEEALAGGGVFAEQGVDLAIERTRAMIAVDIDYVGARGRDPKRDRARANLFAVQQAMRLIRLKSWGGLVSVDLAGARHDGEALSKAARTGFAQDDAIVVGPITRFGVLQLSLPWTRAPIEECLGDRSAPRARALDILRRLNHAALSDRSVPLFIARCAPEEATLAAPLAERLGPRVSVRSDPAVAPGQARIEEA